MARPQSLAPAGAPPGPRAESQPTGLRRGFAALRHRNYRIFWFSQLVSLTGTWMQSLAQSWLVLTLTDSAFQLGLINVCQFAPTLVLGLPGGVLADRIPKRRLLLITQTIAGTLATTLAFLVASDRVELWHIYAVALGLGIVNAFDMPARQAFVAEMVGKDDLMNAVALNSALFNTTRILGPALAGLLLATVGAAVCFVLNAASYAPVLLALAMMKIARVVRDGDEEATGADKLKEGLAYVRGTPAILLPIVLVGVVATFGMNFNVWVPLLARRDFDIGAAGFGLLMSSMGVGSLAGALTLAFRGKRPRRALMLTTAVAFGALEGVLAVAGAIPLHVLAAVFLMAGIGFCMSTTMALANTTVQMTAPDELRGRVMSIYMTVFAGTTPFGALFAGLTTRFFGTPVSLAIGGATVLLAALGIASTGRLLNLRERFRRRSQPLPTPSAVGAELASGAPQSPAPDAPAPAAATGHD